MSTYTDQKKKKTFKGFVYAELSITGQNRKLTKGEDRVQELGQWYPTLVSP